MIDYKEKFWFFIEQELSEVVNTMKDIFHISGLYRDYEDTWEWLESEDKDAEVYVNISREHNWKNGIYTCPVILVLRRKEEHFSLIEINELGIIIANMLGTVVFYGDISYLGNSKYEFKNKRVFGLNNS